MQVILLYVGKIGEHLIIFPKLLKAQKNHNNF